MSSIRVVVTGAEGFIGQHLLRRLGSESRFTVTPLPRSAWEQPERLAESIAHGDAVVHLAGKNRGDDCEILDVNVALIEKLISAASTLPCAPHIVFASSTHRTRNTSYGLAKRRCEQALMDWTADGSARHATALVIPNVYGPGCRPNYNSVVATFCHQIAQGAKPVVVDDDRTIDFIWVNDLIQQIVKSLASHNPPSEAVSTFVEAPIVKTGSATVRELLRKLQHFKHSRFVQGVIPDLTHRFDASLYATFESYVELADHCWQPIVHADDRGRLCEIVKLAGGGQVFFSTTKPGVVRGNHYHTRKLEWFCVLEGEATIRIRRVGANEVREFHVSGESPRFVSIPVMHAHQIENTGRRDLLTMFWTSEIYDSDDPDTYQEKVA